MGYGLLVSSIIADDPSFFSCDRMRNCSAAKDHSLTVATIKSTAAVIWMLRGDMYTKPIADLEVTEGAGGQRLRQFALLFCFYPERRAHIEAAL